MYLFRALNEFDINSNIEENGIASKKLLYDITYSYYKTNKEFKQLNKVEKDIFIKNNINNYILHHKTTLTEFNISDPDIALNHCRLEYLCKKCHDVEHYDDMHKDNGKRKAMFDVSGQMIPVER